MNRKQTPDVDPDLPAKTAEDTEPLAEGETGVDLETLQARAQERDQYLQMLQRAQADLENYRKRARRDLENEQLYAGLPLVRDLLPVVDNVERALEAARTSDDVGKLIEGIEMVRSQMLETLSRHGVKPIEAVGLPFDPNLHDAMLQRPDSEQPPHTVLGEMEKGFQMHDRVIRPSKVIVSAPPAADQPTVPESDEPSVSEEA